MKIDRVETFLVEAGGRNWLFTKVFTDSGITGISETTIKRKEQTLKSSVEELIRFLLGKDPTNIEDHVEKMYRDAFWVGGAMLSSAISSVEAALWDILGKSVGVPVYKLLGGPTREKIRVYRWIGAGRSESPQAWAEAALAAQDEGYTAVKVGFPGMTTKYGSNKETEGLSPAAIKEVVSKLQAIRDALGWEMDIAIDCGGRFSPTNAIRFIKEVEDLDLLFVEEPVPPENVEALAAVSRAVRTPVATGERLFTKYDFCPLLKSGAAAILQPDVCNVGGIMEMKKIAAIAEAYYIPIAPHNPNGPVATSMTAQVAASITNFLIMETSTGHKEERQRHEQIVQETLKVNNGFLELPSKPGLGMELIDEEMAKHPFVVSDAVR